MAPGSGPSRTKTYTQTSSEAMFEEGQRKGRPCHTREAVAVADKVLESWDWEPTV